MSEASRLLVGQVLAGRYWLQEHLGRGQTGDVFRAQHARMRRAFAVKVLHPELVEDPRTCARFEREAEVIGRLRHRNVISVIDVGETAHSRYIVMELAQGPNLAQLIAEGPMDPARATRLAMQICAGLHHAHERDLIHRDLKPENVIVEIESEEELPKIVDFGLAILREGAGDSSDRLTTRGIVLGTPHYIAPETAMGRPIDRRADLFALGVMLFEMVTGAMPFSGDGVDVVTANVGAPTPTMASRAPDVVVDPLLEALVRKLLEKRPADRFATALEVHDLIALIGSDRRAAAAALHTDLEPRRPMTEAPIGGLEPRRAMTEAPIGGLDVQAAVVTDEVDPLPAPRRGRGVAWATALGLLLLAGIAGLALGPHEAADAIDVELAAAEPEALAPAIGREDGPAPSPPPTVVLAARPPIPPRRTEPPIAPVAITAPVAAAPPIVEAAPVPRDSVIELYASLGRQLKRISDRRDLSADDLWQRYRLVRIQEAIATSATRAEAMNVLMAIERELEARYRSPVL